MSENFLKCPFFILCIRKNDNNDEIKEYLNYSMILIHEVFKHKTISSNHIVLLIEYFKWKKEEIIFKKRFSLINFYNIEKKFKNYMFFVVSKNYIIPINLNIIYHYYYYKCPYLLAEVNLKNQKIKTFENDIQQKFLKWESSDKLEEKFKYLVNEKFFSIKEKGNLFNNQINMTEKSRYYLSKAFHWFIFTKYFYENYVNKIFEKELENRIMESLYWEENYDETPLLYSNNCNLLIGDNCIIKNHYVEFCKRRKQILSFSHITHHKKDETGKYIFGCKYKNHKYFTLIHEEQPLNVWDLFSLAHYCLGYNIRLPHQLTRYWNLPPEDPFFKDFGHYSIKNKLYVDLDFLKEITHKCKLDIDCSLENSEAYLPENPKTWEYLRILAFKLLKDRNLLNFSNDFNSKFSLLLSPRIFIICFNFLKKRFFSGSFINDENNYNTEIEYDEQDDFINCISTRVLLILKNENETENNNSNSNWKQFLSEHMQKLIEEEEEEELAVSDDETKLEFEKEIINRNKNKEEE